MQVRTFVFHYHLCRPLNTLVLDSWLCRGNLKWDEAYPPKLVAAWLRVLLTFFSSFASQVLADFMTEALPVASRNQAETWDVGIFISLFCPQFWADYCILIYTIRSWSSQWRQLVTAIHDEGDGLIVCEWHPQGSKLHSFLSCSLWFSWSDKMATCKVLLWRFLCNLRHVFSCQYGYCLILQENPVMTEDAIRETEELILRTGR